MAAKAPYQDTFGHPEDFRVVYRFYTPAEGGRKHLPIGPNHYRSDFWYEHPDNDSTRIFMIHPEFEDDKGNLLSEIEVPEAGTARMWIIVKSYRNFHRHRIEVGTKGYFMEGGRRVAECEVIQVVGMTTNPTSEEYFTNDGKRLEP